MEHINEMKHRRTMAPEGKGCECEQGGKGSGKVNVSSQGGKSSAPAFKPAADVIGAPIYGELDVPGTGLMKGSNAVGYEGPRKGGPNPNAAGGKVQKPKAAEEAGH